MRNKTSSLIAVVLAVLMLGGMINIPVFADADKDITVCDLTDYKNIQKSGAVASSVYTRSGDFTMQISAADSGKEFDIPVKENDISGKKSLALWIYSPNNIEPVLTLGVVSDNADTADTDYYYTSFAIKRGWNQYAFNYEEGSETFTEFGSPLGWDKIDSVKLWPTYGDNTLSAGTVFYLDDIVATNSDIIDSSEANANAPLGEGPDDFLMYDWTTAKNVMKAGGVFTKDVSLSGEGARIYNATNQLGMYWPEFGTRDFSGYKYMQMSIWANEATGLSMGYFIGSENPETDGVDGYSVSIPVDWQGWKIITIDLEAQSKILYRTPLGMDKITTLETWFKMDSRTELCYDRVWLTNSPREQLPQEEIDNSEPYFIEGQDNEYQTPDSIALLKERYPNQEHPRLILTQADFDELKENVKTNAFLKKAYQNILAEADSYLTTPVLGWVLNDVQQLTRADIARFMPLAFAYKISGEQKYLDRLWAELESVCSFASWNPRSDIDVGDYAKEVALMYDWLYNDLTDDQRLLMRNAMVRNGIGPMIELLRTRSSTFGVYEQGNHTPVTGAGIGMIALALGDEPGYEKVCNEIINVIPETMMPYLNTFAPDGACPEGATYWEYGLLNTYIFEYAMMTALGTDYGIKDVEGQSITAHYPVAMSTPTNGSFNYADATSQPYAPPAMLIFSRLFDDPGVASYRLSLADVVPPGATDLMFYKPGMENGGENFERDFVFNGTMPVASLRSSYDNPNAIYLGIKGQSNGYLGHTDLDKGDFILEALGERWIVNLGSENYGAEGMFSVGEQGKRWTYYKKRAEGSNTLVINPQYDRGTLTYDQDLSGKVEIDSFTSKPSYAYAVTDITNGYTERITGVDLTQVKRGFALTDNRSRVIVQDEIKSPSAVELYSFFHTDASVEISSDKKTAILSKNGKKLKASIISPAEASFEDMPAVTLVDEYKSLANSTNKSVHKLAIHMAGVTNTTISVVFDPLFEGEAEAKLPELMPISSWSSLADSPANKGMVNEIYAGGIPVGLIDGETNYTVEANISEVTAASANGASISITQADENSNTALITAKSGNDTLVYSVTFKPKNRIYKPVKSDKNIDIVSVESENVPQVENPPAAVIDKDFGTRWSADGDVSLIADLGEVQNLSYVNIAFYNGDQRSTFMEIEVSEDKENWTEVYRGQSSGSTSEMESFKLGSVSGRYVKFIGHGTTTGVWNSISEMEIPYFERVEFADTIGHWAEDNISYMANEGFVNGVAENVFSPNGNITYAEGVTLLTRLLGIEIDTSVSGEWYEPYIKAAEANGLVPESWYINGQLSPNMAMTRQDMCMLIAKGYESQNGGKKIPSFDVAKKFTDIGAASEAGYKAIDICVSLRLATGVSDTSFAPMNNVTRAEGTVLLERLYLMLYA